MRVVSMALFCAFATPALVDGGRPLDVIGQHVGDVVTSKGVAAALELAKKLAGTKE